MNEQILRIVTSQTTTTFVQVQDAVTDPAGNVLVPPRLQAVPQPMVYQVSQALPSPEGTPQEPLIVIAIIESYDDESGELVEYEVYSVGDKGSPYERTNRAFITRVPASDVIRKDCRVYANEMADTLAEYANASAQVEPPAQQHFVPPTPAPQQHFVPPSSPQRPASQPSAGQAPPATVGSMGDIDTESTILRSNPNASDEGERDQQANSSTE